MRTRRCSPRRSAPSASAPGLGIYTTWSTSSATESFDPAAAVTLAVLKQKCEFKRIGVPTFAALAGATEELLADWQAMLGHQLPVLPPFESFWEALPEFFRWLEGGAEPAPLEAAPLRADEEVVRPAVAPCAARACGALPSSRPSGLPRRTGSVWT